MKTEKPSADFPYESRFLTLPNVALPSGSRLEALRLHYVDEGEGLPVLFIHGNPTSSYLWRNVLPAASRRARALAIDLMGHGRSDKPDVAYDFEDHYEVLRRFVEELALTDLTLVLHDWGGPLGFRLALEQPERIRAIAAMETFPWRLSWQTLPLFARLAFRAFRTPGLGRLLLERMNLFVNAVLPGAVADREAFSREALATYRSFYPTPASRRALRRWPEQLPLDPRTSTWEAVTRIEQGLQTLRAPVLWLAVRPGAVTTPERIEWLRKQVPDLTVRDLGRGAHFIQEEIPGRIAAELERWLGERVLPAAS
jgi:pimeloyl-ACP methyl ester carboxylesterase